MNSQCQGLFQVRFVVGSEGVVPAREGHQPRWWLPTRWALQGGDGAGDCGIVHRFLETSDELLRAHRNFLPLPNESRLSCDALKKDSLLNLRAPSASSAC